uniref:Uncharacterized protein n=1 Tax=Panagrolaimus sp. ES5 TaxID=591445 RepID=A0AC34EZV7_9BILA
MGNIFSSSPPEPEVESKTPLNSEYPMLDFNNIIHKGVPKMMQVTDDLHRLTNYVKDFRNMMVGLILLSIAGVLIFVFLKRQNARRHSNHGRKRLNEYRNEHSILNPRHRTYPQKSGDWSLQHQNMDKFVDHPGNNSSSQNKMEFQQGSGTTTPANGNMEKVCIDLESYA